MQEIEFKSRYCSIIIVFQSIISQSIIHSISSVFAAAGLPPKSKDHICPQAAPAVAKSSSAQLVWRV